MGQKQSPCVMRIGTNKNWKKTALIRGVLVKKRRGAKTVRDETVRGPGIGISKTHDGTTVDKNSSSCRDEIPI